MDDRRFDLQSARDAAERDETALWVGDFLASYGSDNAVLAVALAQQQHWWVGPVSVVTSPFRRSHAVARRASQKVLRADQRERSAPGSVGSAHTV